MKIGVISRSEGYWTTQRLLQAVQRAGHEARFIATPRVRLFVGERHDAVYDGRSLGDLDAAIPRIGRSLTEMGHMILRHLEAMGIATTMGADALRTARNKFAALQALARAGVPVPRTVLLKSRIGSEEAPKLVPFPAVLKLLSGTQGMGVLRIKEASEAASVVDALQTLGETVALQEFIPHPGVDIRALVVGDEVVGSMKRVAALNEWRTNIHLGATAMAHDLDDAATDVALRATRATGLEIAGVDMVFREEKPFVLEVNACPGFRGLLKATKRDVAPAMVEYAARKARGEVRTTPPVKG